MDKKLNFVHYKKINLGEYNCVTEKGVFAKKENI